MRYGSALPSDMAIRDAWMARRDQVEFQPERRELASLWGGVVGLPASVGLLVNHLRELADKIATGQADVNFMRVSRGLIERGRFAPGDSKDPARDCIESGRSSISLGVTDRAARKAAAAELGDATWHEVYPDTRGWPCDAETRLDMLQRAVEFYCPQSVLDDIHCAIANAVDGQPALAEGARRIL